MRGTCIACKEATIGEHVVYVPCGKATNDGHRLCCVHERAYNELVIGILMDGRKRKKS